MGGIWGEDIHALLPANKKMYFKCPNSVNVELIFENEHSVRQSMNSTQSTIAIGIYLETGETNFERTLMSVFINTPRDFELMILVDGTNLEKERMMRQYSDLHLVLVPEAVGRAACFNMLTQGIDAAVYVFLESGVVAAPGWLDIMLEKLEADPTHGIVGPSTNLCWNEQGRGANCDGSIVGLQNGARQTRTLFGEQVQTLEPLYSLAEFCYVVKKEVVEALGAADEAYQQGPCWEMDYNIRAHLAGYKGLWVGGAYVYRYAPSGLKKSSDRIWLNYNKKLYQKRFCALHLNQNREEYEEHCEGSTCEHFAPADKVQVHISDHASELLKRIEYRGKTNVPLITGVMPTCNRPGFVRRSMEYFARQTWPNKELIIAYEKRSDLPAELPDDPMFRYLEVPVNLSIGEKRNRAISESYGSIITQWDDDDWYHPERLAIQARPIIHNLTDLNGLFGVGFFDLNQMEMWQCKPDLFARMFMGGIHGGTLMYRRNLWGANNSYPDISIAEDARFIKSSLKVGARLMGIYGRHLFVYLRHGTNSWKFQIGRHVDPGGWEKIGTEMIPEEDMAFFRAIRKVVAI